MSALINDCYRLANVLHSEQTTMWNKGNITRHSNEASEPLAGSFTRSRTRIHVDGTIDFALARSRETTVPSRQGPYRQVQPS